MNDYRSDHDETSNFVDVTKVKTDAEKAIAAKEKTKEKRKDKKSTILRTKKITKIKQTATSSRKRKRIEIDEKKEDNVVSEFFKKTSDSESDNNENSVKM